MVSPALLSSKKSDWTTPQHLFDQLNTEFHFDLDAAATFTNKKCVAYLGPDHQVEARRDSLKVFWRDYGQTIWVNPPYPVKRSWVLQAEDAFAFDKSVVMLVPARTDTIWWTEAVQSATEIRFLVGRLHFGGCENSAPFPSALLIWHKPKECNSRGQVVGWWDYR